MCKANDLPTEISLWSTSDFEGSSLEARRNSLWGKKVGVTKTGSKVATEPRIPAEQTGA